MCGVGIVFFCSFSPLRGCLTYLVVRKIATSIFTVVLFLARRSSAPHDKSTRKLLSSNQSSLYWQLFPPICVQNVSNRPVFCACGL